MLMKRIAWTVWALLPVAALAYHFGPGQKAYIEDRSAGLLAEATHLEAEAEVAQDAAYQKHLASLKARKAMMESNTPENTAAAKTAAGEEDLAYKQAALAWRVTADKLREAQDMLLTCGSDKASPVRIERDRALIRAGSIAEGVGDLEMMLDTLSDAGQGESAIADQAREEAATGYYYGARLMRASGKPDSEWREVSGWARQDFRYLAESHSHANGDAQTNEFQRNLELVLNLEQSSLEDLQAKPLPKFSPRAGGNGLGDGQRQGKTKRPPRRKSDARGAGGVGDIDGGW